MHKKDKGFTLIEILIVMVIIGIIAGVAVITIHSNQQKQYETFANQLTNAIVLAEQEAMLRPATLSLTFTSRSFQFYILQRDNTWAPIHITSAVLPSNLKITLKINNEMIPANEHALIIPPSNDLMPFVIFIGKQGEKPYYQIIGKTNGEVSSEATK